MCVLYTFIQTESEEGEGESGDQSRDIPVLPPSQEESDQPTLPDGEV